MKNPFIILVLFLSLALIGCASSSTVANSSKKPASVQTFESFGFEGVRETKDYWIVTGTGRDLFFDNLLAKTQADANKKFAGFFKNRKFPAPTIGKKMTQHMENGEWSMRAFFTVPKPKPPKK